MAVGEGDIGCRDRAGWGGREAGWGVICGEKEEGGKGACEEEIIDLGMEVREGVLV